LDIEKLTRQLYGHRAERTVRLLDQMELTFEELESSASEDELAVEQEVAKATNVVGFSRKRPARQPFPDHLPRERVVEPGPAPVHAAAARDCASWARTSPSRWRWCRGSGR
jgi:transposase